MDAIWFQEAALVILCLAQIWDNRQLRRLARDMDSLVAAMLIAGTLKPVDVSESN